MAITGQYGGATAPAAAGLTDTEKALLNKVRELEKKLAHLDANVLGTDDIETETTFQATER